MHIYYLAKIVAMMKITMIFAKYMMTYLITNWSSPQFFTLPTGEFILKSEWVALAAL